MTNITPVLDAIERSDASTDGLLHLVYDELRLLKATELSQKVAGQMLQATSLVGTAQTHKQLECIESVGEQPI